MCARSTLLSTCRTTKSTSRTASSIGELVIGNYKLVEPVAVLPNLKPHHSCLYDYMHKFHIIHGYMWMFPKIVVPQNGWFIMVPLLKFIIWRYPYSWKHPCIFWCFWMIHSPGGITWPHYNSPKEILPLLLCWHHLHPNSYWPQQIMKRGSWWTTKTVWINWEGK